MKKERMMWRWQQSKSLYTAAAPEQISQQTFHFFWFSFMLLLLLLLLEFFLLAHKVQITSIPSRPFMSFFPFIADVTATYARDVNVCRKKGFVCVYLLGVAGLIRYTAVPHQHQSSMDSYRHRTPPSPFTTPPRCYPARPPYRHPHQYAPSAQHRGANKRPIEEARDANDATTPSPAHRVTSSSLFFEAIFIFGNSFFSRRRREIKWSRKSNWNFVFFSSFSLRREIFDWWFKRRIFFLFEKERRIVRDAKGGGGGERTGLSAAGRAIDRERIYTRASVSPFTRKFFKRRKIRSLTA